MRSEADVLEFPEEFNANAAHAYIAGKAEPYNRTSGVYFLVRRMEVVYVGQSVNVDSRLAQHDRQGRKDFDSAYVMPVPRERLDEVEEKFIRLLEPRYNGESGRYGAFHEGTEVLHQMVHLPQAAEELGLPHAEVLRDRIEAGALPEPMVWEGRPAYPRPMWDEIKRGRDVS